MHKQNHITGQRNYELTNHLGNVLSVISDKVMPHDNGSGIIDYYLTDIRQSTDYSPFGVTLHDRNLTKTGAEKFRFGFQNQEMDDEIKSEGNSVNFEYRMHDPRVGRFFAIDPLTKKYPHYTPYSFSGNKVIQAKEIEGCEEYFVNQNNLNEVIWNIFGREFDRSHSNEGPELMTLTQNSQGIKQTITRPILESEPAALNAAARTNVTQVAKKNEIMVVTDVDGAGDEPTDVVRGTGGGGLSGRINGVGGAVWPGNTIETVARGTAAPGTVAVPSTQSFNLVAPSGAGNADGTTGAGPYSMTLDFGAPVGVNLQLVDNFGATIYNGPSGRGISVGLAANTTAIRATITNTTANASGYNVNATVPGTSDNAVTVQGGDSQNLDVNGTAPTSPGTRVTNTSVTVGRPTPASSGNHPLNEISQ